MYAPLIKLDGEPEYREYYLQNYCKEPIICHDGLIARFRPETFDHAFYQNVDRRKADKSLFSIDRAERIGWIKKVIQDNSLTMYAGWDTKRSRYDHSRRVCIVTPDSYVVVLRIVSKEACVFTTAYLIDNRDVEIKIKRSPIWTPK